MKLIDLLVQELPKHSGWPIIALAATSAAHENFVRFVTEVGDINVITVPCLEYTGTVTREQYEAALAASQQPAWNGEGLPPVGVKVEYTCLRFSGHNRAIEPQHWYAGTIIAYYEGFVWTSDNGIRPLENTKFRPIRTEAERRREEVVSDIQAAYKSCPHSDCVGEAIFEQIAAGKIRGVKLED